jgi:hypothetical protein
MAQTALFFIATLILGGTYGMDGNITPPLATVNAARAVHVAAPGQ